MLKITVVGDEYYDQEKNEFFTVGDFVLELEHCLVSVAKWESKYQRPFLSPGEKTIEETLAYVEAMVMSNNTPPNFTEKLSQENLKEINSYIEANLSGTTFPQEPVRKTSNELISSELIYYWLVSYNIPFEVQYWHLSRLFALIRVCGVKNAKPKKASRREAEAQRRALNQERRARLGTSG